MMIDKRSGTPRGAGDLEAFLADPATKHGVRQYLEDKRSARIRRGRARQAAVALILLALSMGVYALIQARGATDDRDDPGRPSIAVELRDVLSSGEVTASEMKRLTKLLGARMAAIVVSWQPSEQRWEEVVEVSAADAVDAILPRSGVRSLREFRCPVPALGDEYETKLVVQSDDGNVILERRVDVDAMQIGDVLTIPLSPDRLAPGRYRWRIEYEAESGQRAVRHPFPWVPFRLVQETDVAQLLADIPPTDRADMDALLRAAALLEFELASEVLSVLGDVDFSADLQGMADLMSAAAFVQLDRENEALELRRRNVDFSPKWRLSDDVLKKAREALERSDFVTAFAEFEQCHQGDPSLAESVDARAFGLILADALLRAGQLEDAEKSLDLALAAGRDAAGAELYVSISEEHHRARRGLACETCMVKAARRYPRTGADPKRRDQIELRMAQILIDNADAARAMPVLDGVIERLRQRTTSRAPELLEARLSRGAGLIVLRRIDEAIEELEGVLEIIGTPPPSDLKQEWVQAVLEVEVAHTVRDGALGKRDGEDRLSQLARLVDVEELDPTLIRRFRLAQTIRLVGSGDVDGAAKLVDDLFGDEAVTADYEGISALVLVAGMQALKFRRRQARTSIIEAARLLGKVPSDARRREHFRILSAQACQLAQVLGAADAASQLKASVGDDTHTLKERISEFHEFLPTLIDLYLNGNDADRAKEFVRNGRKALDRYHGIESPFLKMIEGLQVFYSSKTNEDDYRSVLRDLHDAVEEVALLSDSRGADLVSQLGSVLNNVVARAPESLFAEVYDVLESVSFAPFYSREVQRRSDEGALMARLSSVNSRLSVLLVEGEDDAIMDLLAQKRWLEDLLRGSNSQHLREIISETRTGASEASLVFRIVDTRITSKPEQARVFAIVKHGDVVHRVELGEARELVELCGKYTAEGGVRLREFLLDPVFEELGWTEDSKARRILDVIPGCPQLSGVALGSLPMSDGRFVADAVDVRLVAPPARRGASRPNRATIFAGVKFHDRDLAALDKSERVATQLAESTESLNLVCQDEASTAAFLSSLGGVNEVYLSTHGRVVEPTDASSARGKIRRTKLQLLQQAPMALAAAVFADRDLRALEIEDRELGHLDFVFLGICSGADGHPGAISGSASLQKAFSVAGARVVVASVARVRDAAIARMMEELVAARRLGLTPSDALWRAQCALRDARDGEGKPVFEYADWAPWTVICARP